VSPGDFLRLFPEFRETDGALIAAKLNAAAARMGGPDFGVWPPFAVPTQPPAPPAQMSLTDLAQGNCAAHYLISSPFGTDMRLEPGGSGRSVYLDLFDELCAAVGGTFVVASQPFGW
jgi:hypothetical protein